MPRIVILDGYTLNPGDLDWKELEKLGETVVYDRTPANLTLERSTGADILLTNKAPLPRQVIEGSPSLKFIGVLATGYNVVDIAAAKERGIPVSNVPGYGTAAVAQHVFALLLELTQRTGLHSDSVRAGDWTKSVDWCYWRTPLVELAGLTMGIVGYGAIGKAVARIAQAFGMQVLAATRTPRKDEESVHFTDVDDLFRRSDVVSLHCPLTPETQGMVNAGRLATMKPSAFLINTGRGPLVVEQDLANALRNAQLAGAAMDVLSTEPPATGNPLLTAPHCLITPHLAWAARASRQRLMDAVVENVRAFLNGAPVNVVNS
ncbi:MAG TPA: D-2-hydroxyacid dehydrogenase [Verrucomicrobiales bacterium]|nr:D-2-hydroxyacid dehydrogenase [Verrucomicrobiales bacterium]